MALGTLLSSRRWRILKWLVHDTYSPGNRSRKKPGPEKSYEHVLTTFNRKTRSGTPSKYPSYLRKAVPTSQSLSTVHMRLLGIQNPGLGVPVMLELLLWPHNSSTFSPLSTPHFFDSLPRGACTVSMHSESHPPAVVYRRKATFAAGH